MERSMPPAAQTAVVTALGNAPDRTTVQQRLNSVEQKNILGKKGSWLEVTYSISHAGGVGATLTVKTENWRDENADGSFVGRDLNQIGENTTKYYLRNGVIDAIEIHEWGTTEKGLGCSHRLEARTHYSRTPGVAQEITGKLARHAQSELGVFLKLVREGGCPTRASNLRAGALPRLTPS